MSAPRTRSGRVRRARIAPLRARQISEALAVTLPDDREEALGVLVRSLDSEWDGAKLTGMASCLYLPHVFFVAEHGLDHCEAAMSADIRTAQADALIDEVVDAVSGWDEVAREARIEPDFRKAMAERLQREWGPLDAG